MKNMQDLRKAVDQAKEIYIWVALSVNTVSDGYNQPAVNTLVGGYMLTYKAQVKALINCLNVQQQKMSETKFHVDGDRLYIDSGDLVQPSIPLDIPA